MNKHKHNHQEIKHSTNQKISNNNEDKKILNCCERKSGADDLVICPASGPSPGQADDKIICPTILLR